MADDVAGLQEGEGALPAGKAIDTPHEWFTPDPARPRLVKCRNCPAHKGSTLGDLRCGILEEEKCAEHGLWKCPATRCNPEKI